jgi:uncharacterized protein
MHSVNQCRCWLQVSETALRLGLGKIAEMVLTGQRVIPAPAQKSGFPFRYANLRDALEACRPL